MLHDQTITDAMVDAYLVAQRATVEEADRNFGRPNIGGMSTDTVRSACRAGLAAALRAQPTAATVTGDEREALCLFDDAVATELPHVSRGAYNSFEICKWFAANVRKRIARAALAAPAAPHATSKQDLQVSAPQEQPSDEEIIDMAVEPLGIDCDRMPYGIVVFARALLSRYGAAPQAARDAARYREVRRGQHWSVVNGIGETLRAEALDAAIDSIHAALTTQGADHG